MEHTIYTKRFDLTSVSDVTEDFILPDYVPEIRRVVGVRGVAAVDGKYLSGDELECDGGVTYTVLYTDNDGKLCQTSQTSSFTARALAKSEDDRYTLSDIMTSCTAENVTCRVSAPRKITLSSKVKMHALSERGRDISMKKSGDFEAREKCVRGKSGSVSELRAGGECSGEIREREGAKIITASGEVCVSDVRFDKGQANVKGDAYILLCLAYPDGNYVTSRGRALIEEEIPIPDSMSGGELMGCAFGNAAMIEIDTSDDGTILWRMEYDIDIAVAKREEYEATQDAYAVGAQSVLEESEYESYYPAAMQNGRLTASASAKIRNGARFVCGFGTGSVDKCEIKNGRMLLCGNVKISAVTELDGEMQSDECVIPYRYECDAAAESADEAVMRSMVRVSDIQGRCEGENINLTAELAISAAVMGVERIKCISKITKSEGETSGGKNVIRLYVPDENESAWDVEKRFCLAHEAKLENDVYII